MMMTWFFFPKCPLAFYAIKRERMKFGKRTECLNYHNRSWLKRLEILQGLLDTRMAIKGKTGRDDVLIEPPQTKT